MNVTPIFLRPPVKANGHLTLTPEQLAATFARYSRSNHGIREIAKDIDPQDPDASVDRIFKFVDYGHASIGGLAGGVAMAIDGISMWLAYKLFDILVMGDGQESSTRYIVMKPHGAVDPQAVGIPAEFHERWRQVLAQSIAQYQDGIKTWTQLQQNNPSATNIPPDSPPKVAERLTRNFALDRSRYALLLAMKTNVALVASARVWAETIRHLASLPQIEARNLATALRDNLNLFAPRLTKHSTPEASYIAQANADLAMSIEDINNHLSSEVLADACCVNVLPPTNPFFPPPPAVWQAFREKQNRYSRVGQYLRRMAVRFSWNNVAVAELRDLNRHRTGHRMSLLSQRGVYFGPEPLGPATLFHPDQAEVTYNQRAKAADFLAEQASLLRDIARSRTGYPSYVYSLLLGSQSPFEHLTTADKFIYEAELRTDIGAHYRYAEHLTLAAEGFFRHCPDARPHVRLGTAEPE